MIHLLAPLLFPQLCGACCKALNEGEKFICLYCRYHLPKTDFHKYPENPLIKKLWGRIPLQAAASLYYFNRGEKVQRLIHNFKYSGQDELGFHLGKMYGTSLKNNLDFNQNVYTVPVPLHPEKKKSRGFNQAEIFAQGLAEGLGIKCLDLLERKVFSESQTRKSRIQRWENVENIFSIKQEFSSFNEACGLILVDDVVTTGATLEAAANALLTNKRITLSLLTLAYAST